MTIKIMELKDVTRIIGLMSGTSHDGIDAALVEIRHSAENLPPLSPHPALPHKGGGKKEGIIKALPQGEGRYERLSIIPPPLTGGGEGEGERRAFSDEIDLRLIKHLHIPYLKSLRDDIRMAFHGNTELVCRLNFRLGDVFAKAVLSLLKQTGLRPQDVDAVASHGQTIYHIPPSGRKAGSTLQIGEAAVIAEKTGILTISDFRTADMAAGGQGAPLVPLTDYLLFSRPGQVRAVLNIGGTANVTIVKERPEDTVAFDIGPGNSLIDEAMRFCTGGAKTFDRDGSFARSGRPVKCLLDELLSHPYFRKRPPKSTGRETFGAHMVEDIFKRYNDHFLLRSMTVLALSEAKKTLPPKDILATLTHLTAITIFMAVSKFSADEVILTGGGAKNRFLVSLLHKMFEEKGIAVSDILIYDIPPQAKEAVSFSLLGYLTLNHRTGNIPSVTGARHGVILGKITLPFHRHMGTLLYGLA